MAKVSLADAITKADRDKPKIFIYGPPGTGKTELAAQYPKPFFICSPGETGISKLIGAASVPATPWLELKNSFTPDNKEIHEAWQNLLDILDQLLASKDYETVVIDCIDGFIECLGRLVLDVDFKGNDSKKEGGYNHFGAGTTKLLGYVATHLIPKLESLKNAGLRVVLIAHSELYLHQNPEGADYMKHRPYGMPEKVSNRLFGWADMVLFLHSEVYAMEGEGIKKGKATGSARKIRTVDLPLAFAKNRSSLPQDIDMGNSGREAFANLCAALKESRDNNLQQLAAQTQTQGAQ